MGFVRRRTRRRTMMVAGGMAYAAGRNRGASEDSEGYGDEPQEDFSPAPPSPAPSADSDTDELERLADLHTNGTLTDEEFAAAKAKVLGI